MTTIDKTAKANKGGTTKTYFEHVARGGRGSTEVVDPFAIVIAGLDEERSAEIAARGEKEAEIIAAATMAESNREIRALLSDPNKFFKSYPNEARRVYNLNCITDVIVSGYFLVPIIAENVGPDTVVDGGRHRTAWARLIERCMKGEVVVDALMGAIQKVRDERGADWTPALRAIRPATGSTTAEVADKENNLRLVPTLRETFDRAMLRVKGARMSEKEPDWNGIARSFNLSSGNVAKSWEILSEMHPKIIGYVLEGYNEAGDKFPLNSAIQFKTETHTKQLVKVEAMIAEGDTRVSTAKNTAKSGRGGSSGGSSGGGRSRGAAGEGGGDEADAGDEAGDETPKSVVVKGPWGVRDLKSFVDKHEDMPIAFKAVVKLLTKGPDMLDATERMSVPFLNDYLRAATGAAPAQKPPRAKK